MPLERKTITASSDGSGGMIVGQDQSKETASKLVEAAMRGVVQAAAKIGDGDDSGDTVSPKKSTQPAKISDDLIKRVICAAITAAEKAGDVADDVEIEEFVTGVLMEMGVIRQESELDPERVLSLIPAARKQLASTKATVGEVKPAEVNVNANNTVRKAKVERKDGTPTETVGRVPTQQIVDVDFEAESIIANDPASMTESAQLVAQADVAQKAVQNVYGLKESIERELDQLLQPKVGQTRQPKDGVTHAQIQAVLDKKNVLNEAASTRYSNGKYVAEVIDDLIADGFTNSRPKPAGRLELFNSKGETVLLNRRIEVNYYKLAMGMPVKVKAEINEGSELPTELEGSEVIGSDGRLQTPDGAGLPSPVEFAHETEPSLSKQYGKKRTTPKFLPNERVYSKSLRSLAEVVKSEFIDGTHIYSIKLIDSSGVVHGTGIVQQSDLQPRSMRAIKRIKADTTERFIRAQIEGLINQLKAVTQTDENGNFKRIPVAKLDAICAEAKSMLKGSDFEEAFTKATFRKYVRAVQDIAHTIAGAKHILTDSIALSEEAVTKSDADLILQHGQKQVFERCKNALDRAEGVLMAEVPLRTAMNYDDGAVVRPYKRHNVDWR